MLEVLTSKSIERRKYWVNEIQAVSGNFSNAFSRLEKELSLEIINEGADALLDHLRLCADIPELYVHDSSEEKLYSKYTDALLCETYKFLGLKSLVITERADVADVESFATDYSFVADAKTFRLSRTAKNQKDFKVQAMDGWKRGKPYAMVVCPIYQLPAKSSQIYNQAIVRNVCIFTYSHLAMIVNFYRSNKEVNCENLLKTVFESVGALNPSKNANDYWYYLNRVLKEFHPEMNKFWCMEKIATQESIIIAKEQALIFLANERENIMRMSHEQALHELIRVHKLESKMAVINGLKTNEIWEIK